MAKFEQLAETTNLMKLNSLEPLLPCYFSLPCCEDHGSPSHGDKCPHVWNLAKKAEVPNTLTSWHSKLSFYVISVEFTAWSCILELQSGFAQRPYWRARVSTGHPNRSWTLHSPSHASPACKASPQFQFRRTVTNFFQVTHPTNWANQCSEKLVPYELIYFPWIFHPFQTQLPTIHPPRVLLQRTTLEWLHVQLPEWSRSQPGSRFSHKDSRNLLPIRSTHQNSKFIKFHHVILRYLQLVGDLENWASNLINSESIIEISTPQWLKRNSSLHFDGTRIPNMCTNVGVLKLMYM